LQLEALPSSHRSSGQSCARLTSKQLFAQTVEVAVDVPDAICVEDAVELAEDVAVDVAEVESTQVKP